MGAARLGGCPSCALLLAACRARARRSGTTGGSGTGSGTSGSARWPTPTGQRDIDYLVGRLRYEERCPELDLAIRAARRYERAEPGEDQDRAWDAVLEPIDRFLERRQAEHLRAVAESGRSGPIEAWRTTVDAMTADADHDAAGVRRAGDRIAQR